MDERRPQNSSGMPRAEGWGEVTGTVGSATTRLIVLRGNSGSGKTTLAQHVKARRPNNTLAVIGQDNLRRTILGTRDHPGNPAIGLIDLTARYALAHGLDVLIEGILFAENYGPMLRRLVEDHRGRNGCFLYDVSFEETLRRHETKKNVTFGEAEMRDWWHGHQPVAGLQEQAIAETETLEETVTRVLTTWDS